MRALLHSKRFSFLAERREIGRYFAHIPLDVLTSFLSNPLDKTQLFRHLLISASKKIASNHEECQLPNV